MKLILFAVALLLINVSYSQNIGLGVSNPTEKLEVNGKLRTDSITIVTGGSQTDFLIRSNAQGVIGFRKGHGGLALNFIICYAGTIPTTTGSNHSSGPYIGDIRMFAGDYAPQNWLLCNGQFLKKDSAAYIALYSIIGNTYGSTDTNFAVPDLRGLVPVGVGTAPAGYIWNRAQRNN